MGFWDAFFREETREEFETEKQSLEERKYYLNINMMGLTGIDNDKYTANEVLSIPVAKACNDIIVNSIKTLKVELYRHVEDDVSEQIYDDPRLTLLNDSPNLISTGIDLKAQIAQDLVLHGNAYVAIKRDGNDITELWGLRPQDINIDRRVEKDSPYIVRDYTIHVTGATHALGIDDVMIATVGSDDNGLTGKGVIARGERTIELALNEIELSKNIMANGSAPTSVIKLKKSLGDDAQRRLRESWKKLFQGSKNAGKLVILEDDMDYEKISFSPAELGLTASRSKTSTDLCNLFGVPEQMIDASSNTYGSVESMSIRFLQYCISPIINTMETMFNRSLLLEKEKKEGYFFKINTDDVLKSTQEERFSALQTGINAGILSLNEARIKENMPPIPDDFIKLSLGSVMYYPDKGTLFVPNMSTTFDATTNKIIDSPQMVKNGDNRIEGDETPKTEQKTEEIDTKQAEKTQKDEKGDKK